MPVIRVTTRFFTQLNLELARPDRRLQRGEHEGGGSVVASVVSVTQTASASASASRRCLRGAWLARRCRLSVTPWCIALPLSDAGKRHARPPLTRSALHRRPFDDDVV